MTSVIHHALREFLRRKNLRNESLLIGVSGGADSVALLRGLADLSSEFSLRIEVAHYDHALRSDSESDCEWVLQLSHRLGLTFHSQRREVSKSGEERLAEESARRLRYDFLVDVAQKIGARFISVAHTADDQVETVLHHLFRGTGLAGMAGIPEERSLTESVTLIRPLLTVRRAELVIALKEWDQSFLTDSSNVDGLYTRNRIRHDLIPRLREILNPQVDNAVLRFSAQAEEAQEVIVGLASELLDRACLDLQPGSIRLDRHAFESAAAIVVRESLRQLWHRGNWPRQNLSFAHLDQLANMLRNGAPSRISLPHGVEAACRGHLLELRRETPPRA